MRSGASWSDDVRAAGAQAASPLSAWRTFDYSHAPALATPVQRAPADGERFTNFPRTTTLAWAAVDAATGYRVEVDYGNPSPTGTAWTPLLRQDVGEAELTFDLVGAQPGRWRQRDRQVRTSLASPPSDWRTFPTPSRTDSFGLHGRLRPAEILLRSTLSPQLLISLPWPWPATRDG
jgi:hypothetical protein